MNKKEAIKRIKEISTELNEHNVRYYTMSDPVISDQEYDQLLKELLELEEQFPELKKSDSPTQRVGVKVNSALETVEHRAKMYSLDNTYSLEELDKWRVRVEKLLSRQEVEYMVELKMDGISAALLYEKGVFVRGATRGDGTTGENVTHTLKTVKSIPLKLDNKKSAIPDELEVRTEIYMNQSDFRKMNEVRKKNKEALFANPRNATSGSVKLLDARITAQRQLNCFVHSFGVSQGVNFRNQQEFIQTCQKWGLAVNPYNRLCKNFKEVISFCQEFEQKRMELPYEVDGVVVKVNDFIQQQHMGFTAKSPRWAVAFKFQAYQATTVVRNISIQVGRTGVLTPVADLEPVECAGVTISRSTLHNFDEVARLGLREGDRVLIERAGDVIPKIIKVVDTKKSRKKKSISIPTKCPECGGPVVKMKEDDVAYRCNNPSCPKKMEKGLLHFASRGAMDIEGLGESVVVQLLEKRFVRDLADIYFLTKEQLLTLDLFAEKKADNLLESIEKSKKRPLSKFIFALGITNVGAKVSSILAREYGSVDALARAKHQDIQEIHEVGEVIAKSVEAFFKQRSTSFLLKKFHKAGLSLTAVSRPKIQGKWFGKKFVLTGELTSFTRQEAAEKILAYGGDTTNSVSKKTDFVIVGENPGSKFDKAKKLGVQILNENEFKEMLHEKKS